MEDVDAIRLAANFFAVVRDAVRIDANMMVSEKSFFLICAHSNKWLGIVGKAHLADWRFKNPIRILDTNSVGYIKCVQNSNSVTQLLTRTYL